MSDAQDKIIRNYWSLIGNNAISHAIRAARETGIFEALVGSSSSDEATESTGGQKTLGELVEICDLQMDLTDRLLNVLIATGLIERYGDHYAASQVLQLLTQYDADFGEAFLGSCAHQLRGDNRAEAPDAFRRHSVGRGWTRTPLAMQAAAILDIGASRQDLRILEIGTGAGVWSAAFAFRDAATTVVAVDHPDALESSREMIESINLQSRWSTFESDPCGGDLPEGPFDLVILPELIQTMDDDLAVTILGRAADVTAPEGEVLVIDMFDAESPKERTLATAIHDLELALRTPLGRLRRVPLVSQFMEGAGLETPQYAKLDQAPQNFGLLLATRPANLK